MPNMDFVIESENRLWGCRYGIANNGEVVNEIFAKMGDKSELIGKLAEMYNEPISALVDDPEENAGNVSWTASW